jgi:hypothetical protein
MSLIGLDLNATRARALQGAAHSGPFPAPPEPLPLDDRLRELPLALSLEERQPRVGRAGASLTRRMPHLACTDFLPHLGDARTWSAGRHRLDAARAVGLVFEHLQRLFGRGHGAALALPAYLTDEQVAQVRQLAEHARWRLLGTVSAPVAAAMAARDHLPWSGLAVIVDVDGHALTCSAVGVGDERARLLHVRPVPQLGRGAWLGRLLDGVARRCIRQSRRDPRESAEAEQCLYDQLADLLGDHPEGPLELVIQAPPSLYLGLSLQPAELASLCAPLVQQAAAEVRSFLSAVASFGPVGAVLLTGTAGRLPGLAAALEALLADPSLSGPATGRRSTTMDQDFGEGLAEDVEEVAARLHVLDADAIARGAHELARRLHRGEVQPGHVTEAALGGGSDEVDRGPVRLHFSGKDHPLSGAIFTLGRDPACDIVFDSNLYPTVSARHCEVLRDRRAWTLRDRSRHGTLVNDSPVAGQVVLQPGDWIRLGPGGPVLRFLGQSSDQQQLMPTA